MIHSSPRRGDRIRDKDRDRDKEKGKSSNGVDLLSKLAAINARVVGAPAAAVSLFVESILFELVSTVSGRDTADYLLLKCHEIAVMLFSRNRGNQSSNTRTILKRSKF